jgi:c-di-GMP-related signal transduction protein
VRRAESVYQLHPGLASQGRDHTAAHEQTVVEILENLEPDDLVVAACERLRASGYTIALDDYVANDPRAPLAGVVDFIKVDFERTTPVERAELVKRLGNPKCQMLAEKVETREQFETALKAGFTTFRDISSGVRKCCVPGRFRRTR